MPETFAVARDGVRNMRSIARITGELVRLSSFCTM
jgi:hypothetical protein